MSDISDAGGAVKSAGFGRKVGPLPIWGWAVIIIGGAAVFYFFFMRNSNAGTGAAQSANGVGLGAVPSSGQAGTYSTAFGTGDNSTASGYSSNAQWLQAALNELHGSSQYTPVQLQTAYGNLESGNPLSATDTAILNQVEGSIGLPPGGVPTPNTIPPVAATAAPVQPAFEGFVRDPAGEISALFANNEISPYANMGALGIAQNAYGKPTVTQLNQQQYSTYKRGPVQNILPGQTLQGQ